MSELIETCMFWVGMWCGPLSLVFLVYGWLTKSEKMGMVAWALSPFAACYFIWYFRTLGTALGDKLGTGVYPVWWHYMLGAILPAMFLAAVRFGLGKWIRTKR